MTPARPRVVCITGLTASGKSRLALQLAERLDAEILSVDSMQVYRGFDIGTAKPSAAEQARIRHHGIDLADPEQTYSAGAFLEYARPLLSGERPVLAVGGTGLYLRAVLHGLVPGPSARPELRAKLRAEEADEQGAMHRRLEQLDPEAAARLHPNDLVRVERALEVVLTTGEPLSVMQAAHAFADSPFDAWLLAVRRDRATIRSRIAERARAMLEAGWVDEVRALLEAGVPRDCTPMRAIGYPQVLEHLDGELPIDRLFERICTATRRFAKRQATWFNREPAIEWVDPHPRLAEQLAPRVRAFLGEASIP